MKKILFLTLLFLSFGLLFGQTQQGIVKTRGRMTAEGNVIPGTRLNGATINVRNISALVTDNDGTFLFTVPSKTFFLTNVQKQGYILCDHDILSREHQYSANPFVVVMETPDNNAADRLAAEKNIRNTLRRQLQEREIELDALKEQQKISEEQYRKQLQELYVAQGNNEKIISDMADRYSSIDFDEMDEFHRKVAFYIQNGELTHADSLLNAKGSMEERSAEIDRLREINAKEREKLEKSEKMAETLLEDFADDCYSKFEICKMQHKNDSAAYWLELRASKDTMNVEWLLDAGSFIADYICDYGLAMSYFQRSLFVSRKLYSENSAVTATCYYDMACVYYRQANYIEAINYNKIALDIRTELFGEKHDDVIDCYILIGSVYRVQKQFSQSLEYYQKALSLATDLHGEKSLYLARIFDHIGTVYHFAMKYDLSLEYYLEALKIRKEFSVEEDADIAESYNHVGLIYSLKQSHQQSLEYFQKALDIYLSLYGEHHIQVATCYLGITQTSMFLKDYPKALSNAEKSLKIYHDICGDNHSSVKQIQSIIRLLKIMYKPKPE